MTKHFWLLMVYFSCTTLSIMVNCFYKPYYFHFLLSLFLDSSFSENFYGLKRLLLNGKALTLREKELSLIFLVVLPYFKRKIDDKVQMYRIEEAEGYLRKVNLIIH